MDDGFNQTPRLRTVRQKSTTTREYNSPAARARASSCGVGVKRSRRTSYRFLVFDVLFDDSKRRTPYGGDKVGVGPQRRQPTPKPRKFLPQDSRRPTFHLFDQSVDAKLRIHFHKQMYVVRHDLHFDDFSTAFIRHGSENFRQAHYR